MAEVFSHDQSIPIQHKATSSLRIPDDWLTEVKNMNNEQMQGLVLVLRSRNEAQAREIAELRSELASLRLSGLGLYEEMRPIPHVDSPCIHLPSNPLHVQRASRVDFFNHYF